MNPDLSQPNANVTHDQFSQMYTYAKSNANPEFTKNFAEAIQRGDFNRFGSLKPAVAPKTPAFNQGDTPSGFGKSFIDTIKKGGQDVIQAAKDIAPNAKEAGGSLGATALATAQGFGHIAGDIAGTAGGLIGDAIAPLLPDVVKSKIGDASKYVSDKVNQIPGMTPEIHKALSDVFNTLTLEGGAKAEPVVENAAKTAATKVSDAAQSAADTLATKTKQVITKTPEQIAAKQSDFVDKLILPEMNAKATATAIKTGKVAENTALTGTRDVSQTIPNFDKIKTSVEQVPGISSKNTFLQNSNLIHNEISNVAENLKSELQNKGSFTPAQFNKYMSGVKTTLSENPLIVGDAEKTATKLISKFNSLVKDNGYTPAGLLEARKGLDAWMSAQKGNVFNPATESAVSTALRAIRQGGNDFLASRVPDVAVKDMLEHQSNLYRAIEAIAPKAAKEGPNGFQRWISAHPRLVKAAKYGASAVVGGEVLRHIAP